MSERMEWNYLAQEKGRRKTCEVDCLIYDSIKGREYLIQIRLRQVLSKVSGSWIVNQLMKNIRYLVQTLNSLNVYDI
jgi:hypothetical protein